MPVAYHDHGVAAVRARHVHLRGGHGLLRRVEHHVQPPVGFQHGVLHPAYVETALIAQLLHKLVRGEAVFRHLALVDDTFFYQHARLAVQQCAQPRAFQRGAGDRHLAAEQRQYRHEPVYHRNAEILQGMRGEIGDQRRHDKFRKLHLAKLPLAEQAHCSQQRCIYDKCTYNYYRHRQHPRC